MPTRRNGRTVRRPRPSVANRSPSIDTAAGNLAADPHRTGQALDANHGAWNRGPTIGTAAGPSIGSTGLQPLDANCGR